MKRSGVPVLMYHSIGIPNPKWIWNFLTVPLKIFEEHLRVLKRKGFNTIDLLELYDYMSIGKPIPPNSIVLTFDDGYLDNWVYAYPLLRKYGFKGTVFVNPEFVDPTEEYRLNLGDVWNGKVKEEHLKPHGFLSWRELREIEKDGVMDIQSHGMTHTWYFTGPEIIDFRHPGDSYIWMNWNKDTNRKHKYLTENQEDLVELGTPVYKHEKSLAARRYFPDGSLGRVLIEHVKDKGEKEFFKNGSWQKQLFQIVAEYKSKNNLEDEFESKEEQLKRFNWELKESREILEKILDKKINYFCWPGGGYTNYSRQVVNNYYNSTTLASSDQTARRNIPGEDPRDIKRIGIPYIEGKGDKSMEYLGGNYLYLFLREFQGDLKAKPLRKLSKGISLLKHRYL